MIWGGRLTRNKQEFLGSIEEGAKKREYHKFVVILSHEVMSFFLVEFSCAEQRRWVISVPRPGFCWIGMT